jgi:hypothetical protein
VALYDIARLDDACSGSNQPTNLQSTYLREVLVNDGERHFVDVRIVVLLECFNLVQAFTLLNQGAHLVQMLQLVSGLCT